MVIRVYLIFFYFLFFFMNNTLRTVLFRRIVFPYDPQGRVYADGRVGAADEADEHDQGEILRRFAAEEMEGPAGEEHRRQRVDTAVDTLGNAVVSQLFIRIRAAVGPRVFTDAVEDDDGFVHGIADNRQDSRQEGGVDFQLEEGKKAQYHDQVMEDGYDSRNGDLIFKAEGNIGRQGDKGHGQAGHGILRNFRADDGADRFDTLHFRAAQLFVELIGNGLAFVAFQIAHADHHFLRRFLIRDARQLDNAVFQIHIGVVDDFAHLGYRNGLLELQVQNRAACIVDAEVKAVDKDGDDTQDDQDGRQGKPPFLMGYNIKTHFRPPFLSMCSGTLRFNP